MTELLKFIVDIITYFHTYILSLNDRYEYDFSDKDLHFLVIGLLGMAMIFILYPIFQLLAKTGHVMVITWLYVVTVLMVITFAIEIGQKWTGTGVMEFADIAYGMLGFFIFFLLFALIRDVVLKLIRFAKKKMLISNDADYYSDEEDGDAEEDAEDDETYYNRRRSGNMR